MRCDVVVFGAADEMRFDVRILGKGKKQKGLRLAPWPRLRHVGVTDAQSVAPVSPLALACVPVRGFELALAARRRAGRGGCFWPLAFWLLAPVSASLSSNAVVCVSVSVRTALASDFWECAICAGVRVPLRVYARALGGPHRTVPCCGVLGPGETSCDRGGTAVGAASKVESFQAGELARRKQLSAQNDSVRLSL